jgi:outer membrane protein assembly factor BamB
MRHLILIGSVLLLGAQQQPKPLEGPPPGQFTPARGLQVLLEDKLCAQALEIVKGPGSDVYVQFADEKDAQAAAVAAGAQYGTRITVGRGPASRIGLADNLADRLVAPDAPKAEVLRVLAPGGKAKVGAEEFSKPFPAGVDDWSHHYHAPDNNPQSKDQVARGPFMTQFIAEPRYGPTPQAAVSSAGRLFVAFGHAAWHRREEHVLNTLLALNAFNGGLLWQRPVKVGLMVDRSTMVATPDRLYVADDESCKVLDAATGELKDEIALPKDQAGGTFWKWMAIEDGVLYALVGQADPLDPVTKWGSTNHGWPWNGISKGYNEKEYGWGFAKTLFALDPKTKKVLWTHSEEQQIDSRSLCMRGGKVYVSSFGKYLAALDAKSGKPLWRRTAEADTELFSAIGAYRPGHGYIEGWKSTAYVKAADKALYFAGPPTRGLSGVSTADGSLLWKRQIKNLQLAVREEGLYVIGAEKTAGETKKLDPMTGEVLASYDISRRACTRVTGSADGLFFRAYDGTTRLDMGTGKPQWISPMRPSCQVGVIPANGHLYWIPWACDCNLQMFGLMGLAPAGDFKFGEAAVEAERLEKFADAAAEFPVAPADWPAYRADNKRSAVSGATIPDQVKLLWSHKPAAPVEATAPVAAGGLAFVAGADGVVRAFDVATGAVKWTAHVGGAVRYPPAISDGRAFVGSGDGRAYALEASTGKVLWRFRAAPVERRIPILGSLISTWPVGSGVLVEGGTAYLAAGMNCMDGTYVFALDAASGKIKWQNPTSGHLDPYSKTGVAVQGELLLNDGKLYLAGGNAASPGVYDVADGRCSTRPPPGVQAIAPRGRELTLKDGNVTVAGQPLYSIPDFPVFDKSVIWPPLVVTAKNARLTLTDSKEGAKLVALPLGEGPPLWEHPLPSVPQRWGLAVDAGGRIVVTLRSGEILCFGK